MGNINGTLLRTCVIRFKIHQMFRRVNFNAAFSFKSNIPNIWRRFEKAVRKIDLSTMLTLSEKMLLKKKTNFEMIEYTEWQIENWSFHIRLRI